MSLPGPSCFQGRARRHFRPERTICRARSSSVHAASRRTSRPRSTTSSGSSRSRPEASDPGSVDLLGRAVERGAAMLEAYAKIPSRKVDDDLAVSMRGRSDGNRARARRQRLPHASLPDARRDLAGSVDAGDLDVRAVRKARVRLESRADRADLGRVAEHDRVRVADRDRHERDSVRELSRTDCDLAELLLDLAVFMDTCAHYQRADAHVDLARAGLGCEPRCGDTGAVPRELRAGP